MTSQLLDRLARILEQEVDNLHSLSGGCVGEVYAARLQNGEKVVVKVASDGEGNLDIEARMLRYLQTRSQLSVPEVLFSAPELLLLRFVENDGRPSQRAEQEAADALASVHNISAEHYGFSEDTLIGAMPLRNPPSQNWPEFFARVRLLDTARRCEEAGRLDSETVARIGTLAENIDKLLDAPQPPGLIHGDVWSGNVLFHRGRLAGFIDPAIYYADPEIELAFITLFHTFGDAFFARYREHRPIRPGFFELRKDVYNLFPLLVHVYHFGGSYVRSLRSTLGQLGY